MAVIDAVVVARWIDVDGNKQPDAIEDVYAWAIANDEYLPGGRSGVGPYGKYMDLTGQANVHQKVLDDLAVFIAKLEVTPTTAQHFADDSRLFVLGYWRKDADGSVVDDNWDTVLATEERQKAVQYITSNSKITTSQLANVFDVTDTRKEIAKKLKRFFR